MHLINYSVQSESGVDYSIVVKGDYGDQRVFTEIARADLDDYWRQTHPSMTDEDRRLIVEGSEDAIKHHIEKKCAADDWTDVNRFGSTIKKVVISRDDLFGGPGLSDERLRVKKATG